ncbi:hypothetical protein Y032_0288g1480 [Ancylostoma ceylanicum]|uniref:Uncharacterized protein n=1 Tax=Ancylostoma ceylanicum TaxID=53326 RepID=A0A016S626_9BILA|nr:hypothetical protein Y032_0288g1480 [Ancylostoma ceylanicum]
MESPRHRMALNKQDETTGTIIDTMGRLVYKNFQIGLPHWMQEAGAAQQTGGGCRRRVFFGTTVRVFLMFYQSAEIL